MAAKGRSAAPGADSAGSCRAAHSSRPRRRSRAAFAAALFALLLCAGSAIASEGNASSGRPFLEILIDGAEWPGLIIVFMSLASVTIVAEHFWTIRRATIVPDHEVEAMRQLIEARKFRECVEHLQKGRSMFADVLAAGLRHGRHGFEAMREAAEEQANAWGSRLFRRAEYLNIIGNLSPLMGLLGTVLGMIEAFSAMQQAHGAYKPENLAGGISLALVNTFLGLVVAIVSLGFFGVCRNRVDALTVAAQAAVLDLLEYFRPGAGNAPSDAGKDEPRRTP